MDFKEIQGKAEMRLSDMFALMEKAKFYEEAYHKVDKALQVGLQQIVMSVGRTFKGNAPDIKIRVAPFDPEVVINDIVEKDKVLHIFVKMEDSDEVNSTGKDVVVIIKTGNKEVK